MTPPADGQRLFFAFLLLASLDLLLAAAAYWLITKSHTFDNPAWLEEEAAYRAYCRLFGPDQPGPADCHSPEELDQLTILLAGPLAPPPQYADHWRETPAVRLHAKWTHDVALLRQARQAAVQWYRDRIMQATELVIEPRRDANWSAAVEKLLVEHRPWPLERAVPGSVRVPHPRGEPLTYTDVALCAEVQQAAVDWQHVRWQLCGWSDLRRLLESLARAAGLGPLLAFP